jgi:hypothetical protein
VLTSQSILFVCLFVFGGAGRALGMLSKNFATALHSQHLNSRTILGYGGDTAAAGD